MAILRPVFSIILNKASVLLVCRAVVLSASEPYQSTITPSTPEYFISKHWYLRMVSSPDA